MIEITGMLLPKEYKLTNRMNIIKKKKKSFNKYNLFNNRIYIYIFFKQLKIIFFKILLFKRINMIII